jgi:Helitron helicase-like domain at N-terminus
MCCCSGKVKLPIQPGMPWPLSDLYKGTHPLSKIFLAHIRHLNSAFMFASSGIKVDRRHNTGVKSMCISGGIHHLIDTRLQPRPGKQAGYAQLYVIDGPAQELQERLAAMFRRATGPVPGPTSALHQLVKLIQCMMHLHNPFVHQFKQIKQLEHLPHEARLIIRGDLGATAAAASGRHAGRYNAQRAMEIAGLLPDDENRGTYRDIVIRPRTGGLRRISCHHPSYDPLHFVLLHPRGHDGWAWGTPLVQHPEEGQVVIPEEDAEQHFQDEQHIRHELGLSLDPAYAEVHLEHTAALGDLDNQHDTGNPHAPIRHDVPDPYEHEEEVQPMHAALLPAEQDEEQLLHSAEHELQERLASEQEVQQDLEVLEEPEGERPAVREHPGKCVTVKQHAAFHLMLRHGVVPYLHLSSRLFEEFVIDCFCKIENLRLTWLRNNQKQLRADVYAAVKHAVLQGETDPTKVGKHVILPATFQGSERYIKEAYKDSMAIVRKQGKPDLFITITCNPQWREIQENLEPGQKSNQRPDLIARVFNLKLKAIRADLIKDGFLGMPVADLYVIEYQKRGLPHAHMLIILKDEHKLLTTHDIDQMICAELPDPVTEKELYDIVTSSMMHGPCGALDPNAPCCTGKDGVHTGICSKKYPKDFCEETRACEDGYPVYRRRNNGRVFITKSNVQLDNRWVVPYNRVLTMKYNAHINVEHCASVRY